MQRRAEYRDDVSGRNNRNNSGSYQQERGVAAEQDLLGYAAQRPEIDGCLTARGHGDEVAGSLIGIVDNLVSRRADTYVVSGGDALFFQTLAPISKVCFGVGESMVGFGNNLEQGKVHR